MILEVKADFHRADGNADGIEEAETGPDGEGVTTAVQEIGHVVGLPGTFIVGSDCTLKKQIIGEQEKLEEMLKREIKYNPEHR